MQAVRRRIINDNDNNDDNDDDGFDWLTNHDDNVLDLKEKVLRDIEKVLDKPMFDISKPRTMLNWEKLVPELYYNKSTHRHTHHYKPSDGFK